VSAAQRVGLHRPAGSSWFRCRWLRPSRDSRSSCALRARRDRNVRFISRVRQPDRSSISWFGGRHVGGGLLRERNKVGETRLGNEPPMRTPPKPVPSRRHAVKIARRCCLRFRAIAEQIARSATRHIFTSTSWTAFRSEHHLGTQDRRRLRPLSKQTFDCHLMIVEPERYVDEFRAAGAESSLSSRGECTRSACSRTSVRSARGPASRSAADAVAMLATSSKTAI